MSDAKKLRDLVLDQLRTYDRDQLLRIAAGGGPRNRAEDHVVYCPLCRCNKSGDREEPNARTEACNDESCLCHTEEDAPKQHVLAALARELGALHTCMEWAGLNDEWGIPLNCGKPARRCWESNGTAHWVCDEHDERLRESFNA